jgi:hypothetical protein
VACGCGKPAGEPAESFVVTRPNGTTRETGTKAEAKVEVTRSGGGTIVATRKP